MVLIKGVNLQMKESDVGNKVCGNTKLMMYLCRYRKMEEVCKIQIEICTSSNPSNNFSLLKKKKYVCVYKC
jgi:hypothetical protein